MIDLSRAIPISSHRAIVSYDPERGLAIIDSRGLRMSSSKYLGEFNPTEQEVAAIERFEQQMKKKDFDALSESLTEAFCATGQKGGVKNDCPPKRQPKLPSKPTFVSSDAARNAENDVFVLGMIDMFNKADVAGLRAVEHPSPKVQAYAKALRAALAVAGVQGDNPIDLFGSTEVMHTENGKYTEKRRKLHAEIYEKLLAGGKCSY